MTVDISAPPVVVVSPTGVQGPRGNSLLNGVGAPAPTLGVDGDFYLDTAASNLYGPKASGAWPGTSVHIGAAGALLAANNLSDLTNAATARSSLGLGNAATRNVGTATGTVAAGDDSRITGALQGGASAGGDLTGTLPNPTVAKVNGVAVTGTPAAGQVPTATSGTAATWQPLPAASTSTPGVVRLDGTPTDIAPLGTQAAGSIGKVADAGHVHAMPRLDQVGAPTAAVSMNGQKLTSVASGTAAGDAVNVAQIPNPATVIQAAAPTGVAATDQAAINAAIGALPAAGGVVQLQAGTYVVPAPGSPSSGCINMSVNNSVLRGVGMGVTTIQLAPGSTGVTGIIRTPSAVANSAISFTDMTIDGNATNQTGSPTVIGFFCGVSPNGTASDTDISCIRVEIKNCTGYGFDPHERTTRLLLRDCISHGNGTDGAHDGFTLDACYDSIVEGCTAYGNGRHGFNLVTASNGVTLTGCKSYSNSGNGYTLQNGAKNCVLDGCTAYSNTLDGINVNGVPQTGQQDNTPGVNNVVTGCLIRLSGAHGIHLVGASHNHITGNSVRDSSQTTTGSSNQIYFDESGTTYSTYNTVVDNDLDVTAGVANAPKYGIREKSANDDNNFVFGNRSQGAVTAQISLLGATSLRLAAHNGVNEHPATAPYVQDVPSLHGLVEWNFQPSAAGATSTVTAGKVYLSRITIQNGGTLSNLVINITTAGAGLTASYVAVYDSTGAQLAVSSDISTLLAGTGGIALAFPSTTFAPGAVILAALLVGNGSTTPPVLARGASGAGARNYGLTTASPLAVATYSSGLTAMPASLTLASTTASGAVDFWLGMQ